MDTLLQDHDKGKKGINKILVGAALFAVVLIAGAIWLLSFQPTIEEQKQQELVGAHIEGTPEFESYTKELIITTDMDRTIESRTTLGSISMMLHGDIRNKGSKAIDRLQIKASVVDPFNNTIKEKKLMVVPNMEETLNPNETIHVAVPIDGFSKDDDRANVRWKVTAIRFK